MIDTESDRLVTTKATQLQARSLAALAHFTCSGGFLDNNYDFSYHAGTSDLIGALDHQPRFFQPVAYTNGVYNTVKNGSTVPLKLRNPSAGTAEKTSRSCGSVHQIHPKVPWSSSAPTDAVEELATSRRNGAPL